MKSVCFLFLLLGFVNCTYGQIAAGPVQLTGCGNIMENNYHGIPLYAIQDHAGSKPFGQIVFTPEEGGNHWIFHWKYNGIEQPVPDGDSVSLTVSIPGDGFFEFWAVRDGRLSVSVPEFHIFYDHVPGFTISLSDKDNCKAVTIDAITDFDIPAYRNPGEPGAAEFLGSKSRVYYLVSGKSVPIAFPDYDYALQARQGGFAAGAQDQEVTVTITDLFGFEWTSTPVKYISVVPEAKADFELENTVDIVGEANEQMGQAPLTVRFFSESSNAQQYEWFLYKDTTDMQGFLPELRDSLLGSQIRTGAELDYTYEHPGRYKVRMVAVNTLGSEGCRDTTTAFYINVLESLVDVPNVFTPNGDGKNDVFRVRGLSLESFHGVIINRWGRKIYEWSDPDGGWDGRINGKYASPGTYYYIITAKGREKNSPPKYIKKGALLLVR